MSNSKKKGNKAERELCKWWKDFTGMDFTRIPASGGLRWKGLTSATTGDLICADERHSRRFLFSIESKSYKDINFEHLILGNKKVIILDFWEQCKQDGLRANKVPILFIRYNGMPKQTWFIVISQKILSLISDFKPKNNYLIVKGQDIVIINSNDLVNCNYIELHKKIKKNTNYGKKI
jgi:Holliday junction resolvase